jgi:hypothetical protein
MAKLGTCGPETEAATGTTTVIVADPARRHAGAGALLHAEITQKTI